MATTLGAAVGAVFTKSDQDAVKNSLIGALTGLLLSLALGG
jgi:hypothetical protein